MRRMEVRCCCQPKKRLGWLDVFWSELEAKMVRRIEHIPFPASLEDAPQPSETIKEICLPIVDIHIPGVGKYLAIKSEDTPIETLRKINGFIEDTE